MRPAETFEDFEAVVLREQDESIGMALPFAFASVRDTGASTAGGDPICVTGDGAVIIKHHDDLYGWQAVARNLDRFEALEQLERDAASAGIQAGLGTVCHQDREGGRRQDGQRGGGGRDQRGRGHVHQGDQHQHQRREQGRLADRRERDRGAPEQRQDQVGAHRREDGQEAGLGPLTRDELTCVGS
jgi:hypothetical protein